MLSGKQELEMSQILPLDATFENLTAPLPKREEYLRRVVQNLEGHGPHREAISVRMGIAGQGISPHYKFETPQEMRLLDQQGEDIGIMAKFHETFIIYHGTSHQIMTAFDIADTRDNHWSSKTMSYDDVRRIFGQVRAERKGR
jgi:hypothetical protein